MFKKLAISIIAMYATLTISTTMQSEFKYEYVVIASDNSASSMIQLYNAKQHLIDVYNQEILYKDASLHQHLIIENIELFAITNSVAKYEAGVIVVIIGKGQGEKIEGKLRTSYCDASTVNNRIFILEWISGLFK